MPCGAMPCLTSPCCAWSSCPMPCQAEPSCAMPSRAAPALSWAAAARDTSSAPRLQAARDTSSSLSLPAARDPSSALSLPCNPCLRSWCRASLLASSQALTHAHQARGSCGLYSYGPHSHGVEQGLRAKNNGRGHNGGGAVAVGGGSNASGFEFMASHCRL